MPRLRGEQGRGGEGQNRYGMAGYAGALLPLGAMPLLWRGVWERGRVCVGPIKGESVFSPVWFFGRW